MTNHSLRLGSLVCVGALGAVAEARADFEPGDILAGVEFVQDDGPGRVYRVNEGGNLTATTPDFVMPLDAPVIDVCSTDDGRVLIASSTHQTVYEITSGEAVEFATIPSDASALYCGEGKIFVASFLFSAEVFDITQGGEVTEVFATGINRGLVRNVDGQLWGARLDENFTNTGGFYKGIAAGSDFTGDVPYIAMSDVFASTVHDGRVFGVAAFSKAIVDLSAGMPEFAHALVPAVRGLASSDGTLWASTIEGKVYDVTASLDYTNKIPFATLPGPSLSMAVVQVCGDGEVHGREQCDDGRATDDCYANCVLPRCGDGVLNAALGEECDDGNLKEDDGCDEDCDLEAPPNPGVGGGGAGPIAAGGGGASGGTDPGTGGTGGSDAANNDPGDDGCSSAGASSSGSSMAWLVALALALVGVRRRTS